MLNGKLFECSDKEARTVEAARRIGLPNPIIEAVILRERSQGAEVEPARGRTEKLSRSRADTVLDRPKLRSYNV